MRPLQYGWVRSDPAGRLRSSRAPPPRRTVRFTYYTTVHVLSRLESSDAATRVLGVHASSGICKISRVVLQRMRWPSRPDSSPVQSFTS